jgi:hypothetical protein
LKPRGALAAYDHAIKQHGKLRWPFTFAQRLELCWESGFQRLEKSRLRARKIQETAKEVKLFPATRETFSTPVASPLRGEHAQTK